MNQTQEEQVVIQLEDAIRTFGRPKEVGRQEAAQAFNTRNHGLVCLIEGEDSQWMVPGWHSVNVLDRYVFPLPLPRNVRIEGIASDLLEQECEVA